MNVIERAEELLLLTRKHPAMFATTRESMISRVSTILEMANIMMDHSYFYEVHLGTKGCAYATATEATTDDWAHAVIDDALIKLKGIQWDNA